MNEQILPRTSDDSAPTVDRQLTTNLEHPSAHRFVRPVRNLEFYITFTSGRQVKNPVHIP